MSPPSKGIPYASFIRSFVHLFIKVDCKNREEEANKALETSGTGRGGGGVTYLNLGYRCRACVLQRFLNPDPFKERK